MSKYIFAPANEHQETVLVLKNCIEFIGSYQKGSGSCYARGKRFLRNKVDCSGTSIKFLFKTFPKVINHDFDNYGLFVYRFDKKKCKSILLPSSLFFQEGKKYLLLSMILFHQNDEQSLRFFHPWMNSLWEYHLVQNH